MAQDLVEPIALPPARRPTQIPSLPAWLASQKAAAKVELQMVEGGRKFADVLTLPADLMPTAAQRAAIANHVSSLNSLLRQTPLNGDEYDAAMLAVLTKMLWVLPAAKTTELAAEARGEAYMMALDDVPVWAVEEAIRKWYRGQHGAGDDYHWAPDPARLRELAMSEAWVLRGQIIELETILGAVEYRDCEPELARGRAAMAGIYRTMAGGADALRALTFEEAIAAGQSMLAGKP